MGSPLAPVVFHQSAIFGFFAGQEIMLLVLLFIDCDVVMFHSR